MSRIGKNPITIPDNVDCAYSDGFLKAKGPLGALELPVSSEISVDLQGKTLQFACAHTSKKARMLWGTTQRLASNMIEGVSKGFTKRLEINGVGYRASVQGNTLVLQLGYSHDIQFPIPKGITIACEKPTLISVTGFDKQEVGQVASKIRGYRPPEPYKGKGVKYEGEWILRKEGKKK